MGGPCILSLNGLLILYLALVGVRDPGRSVYDTWNSASEAAIRAQRWPLLVARARQGAILSAGSPGQVAYFHSLACLGEFKLHRYDDALRAGIAARAAALEGRKWRMLARAENCLMRVYRIIGNLELSYEAGLAMLAALDREPGSRTIEYRAFFAYVIAGMGRRQEAIDQLRMVIRESDDLPLPPRADFHFVRALESAKADALEQIGLILLRSGDLSGSEDYLLHAFRIRRLSDPGKLTWSYNSLGELRMAQGRPAEAASLWTKSMADSRAGLQAWYPLYFRARANLALGSPTAALQDMLAALDSVRDLRLHLPFGDEIQVESEVSLQGIFSLAVETAAQLGRADLALAFALESRAHSLRTRAAAGSDWRRRLPPRYWITLAALRSLQSHPESNQSLSLRRELAEMESAAGLFVASLDRSGTHWQEIARSMHPNDRFTLFYLSDHHSIRWTIENQKLRLDKIPPKAAIAAAADAFLQSVRQNHPRHRELGIALFQAIFAGYTALPAGAVWTILPDEQLFQVPLAAVTSPHTGRYLVEENSLRLAAGVSPAPAGNVPSGGLFAAFADPIGNRADSRWNAGMRWWSRIGSTSLADPGLPRLSGSLAEVERCSRVWRKGDFQIRTGRELLHDGILPTRAAVLHFATHMIQPGSSPSASPVIFLGLSDSGNPVSLSETEIESLQANPNLVTLSGCGSGTGRLAPGAGLLGLTRAWLMAGAKGVLASLWDVPDGSGTLFEAFYSSLQQYESIDSRSAAISLSRAQSAAIGTSRISVWSAYFVIGLSM